MPYTAALRLPGLLALCLLQAACAATAPDPTPAPTRYWSVADARWLSPSALADELAGVDYLLLGEIHDNPQHHQGQAALLAALPGGPAVVGFEQLDLDQGEALAAEQARAPGSAAGIREAVRWDDSGWPDWSLYEPVFAAALAGGHRLLPLSFPGDRTMAVAREGYDAVLPAAALAALEPASHLAPAQRTELLQELADAHCGKLPEAMLPTMATVQVARDAHMAWRQSEAGGRGVLILGNGHARRDRGVPRFLARLRPEARIAVVAFLEARPGLDGPTAYPEVQNQLADYVALTPAIERPDPCAGISGP